MLRLQDLLAMVVVAVILAVCLRLDLGRLGPGDPEPVAWLRHGGAVRGAWCSMESPAGAVPSRPSRRYAAFQGIPYAEPPVGARRFAPPRPAQPWRGVRSAVCEGRICPQPSAHPFLVNMVASASGVRAWLAHAPRLLSTLLWSAVQQAEDCLFVNVFVPERDEDDDDDANSSAVLVWLHGGGFLIGDGSPQEYGPDLLLQRGIIVITLNYRLGVLGFLYGGPDSGAPGNAGLRDQALALRWVQENAAGFGGDPARVTLWGESAGAISGHLQRMAGRAPFQRLILSSGVAILPWAVQDRPLDALQRLADAVGWPASRRPDHPRDLVHFLKKLPAEQLVAAGGALKSITNFVGTGMRPLQWLPVVEEPLADPSPAGALAALEGRFLTRSPAASLAEGTFRSVPTMMGVNSREAMVLLAGMGRRSLVRLLQRVDRDFGLVVGDLPFVARGQPAAASLQAAHLIRGFFFGKQRVSMHTLPVLLDLYSDLIFNIGVRETATLEARWASESPNSSLFLYRFSFDGRLGFLKRLMGTSVPGVGHADELGYLFNMKVLPSLSLPLDSPEEVTRRRLISLWTNFVKYGDPTPAGNCTDVDSIQWESNRVENDFYLDIGENVTLRKHIFESRMKFWSDLYRDVLKTPLSW